MDRPVLKVFSTIAIRSSVEELTPAFEAAQGCMLAVTWATAPMLIQKLQAGETADLLILNRAGIDTMREQARLVAGSEAAIASSATAIAVKAGAPRPDISTPEALRRALLDARAISYTDPAAGGASGIHFAKVLERMGIAREINAKTKFPPPSGLAGTFLLTGEADFAVQQVPELMQIPGLDIVGTLPGDLHMVTSFVAGIEAASPRAETARALIAHLLTPHAAAVFRARGLEHSQAQKI